MASFETTVNNKIKRCVQTWPSMRAILLKWIHIYVHTFKHTCARTWALSCQHYFHPSLFVHGPHPSAGWHSGVSWWINNINKQANSTKNGAQKIKWYSFDLIGFDLINIIVIRNSIGRVVWWHPISVLPMAISCPAGIIRYSTHVDIWARRRYIK